MKNKNGVEGLRQIHELFEPEALNATSVKFDEITLAVKVAFRTPEQLITVIKDLEQKLKEYEEVHGALGDGVYMSQASAILANADYETRKHLIA